jgi:1-deoxy-D-xylulose-5-phosphate synthase
MSFEALNHAGHLKKNFLVVLNDNSMSISTTVGALSTYLNKVRVGVAYNELRQEIRKFLDSIPLVGEKMRFVLEHIKDGVKRSMMTGQLFEDLGFRYFGPIDGHNIELLIDTFNRIRHFQGPVLLHAVTQKGHGFAPACEDPETFHSPTPFCTVTGLAVASPTAQAPKTYTDVFKEALIELAREDKRIVAITAAMPDGTGLSAFAEAFPSRYFDVGICEQHAMGLSAGLARGGLRPVAAVYSTFLQRAFDQVFHELSLQELPIVLAIDRAGLVGSDGPTHHGTFDIAYLRSLPNMTLMAPADAAELPHMLRLALKATGPVAIRYPRAVAPTIPRAAPPSFQMGQAEVLRKGPDGALIAYGSMVAPSLEAAEWLAQREIFVTVVNARFVKPLDRVLLGRVLRDAPLALTVEEHAALGGFGSALLEMAAAGELETRRIRCLAIPDRFIEHGPRDLLLKTLDLCADGIAKRFMELRESLKRNERASAPAPETHAGIVTTDSKTEQRSP